MTYKIRFWQSRSVKTWLQSSRVLIFVALGLVLMAAASSLATKTLLAKAETTPEQLNIVYIFADDLDTKALQYMPRTKSLIADQGVIFENYVFNMSLCCPSRASALRGQYSHNTGVTTNEAVYGGGYATFYANGNESSTYGTWLKDAGYTTAYMGKYMNGYPNGAGLGATHFPTGWSEWFGLYKGMYDQYDYWINHNGALEYKGFEPEDYGTDVLAAEAQTFLNTQASSESPFLLVISPSAPHGPYVPADRHKNLFSDVTYPITPSFNEADVSDKHVQVKELPVLGNRAVALINDDFRNRIRSLQAVDEMVEAIVNKLDDQGKLENTAIFFGSDNGLHMGEHRLMGNGKPDEDDPSEKEDYDEDPLEVGGKSTAYEEDITVPLYVRMPGIAGGQVIDKLVGNIDLAPTFADIASASIPDFVDGRSLLPLLEDESVPWRYSYLLQRGIPRLEYYGVRTNSQSYVHYATDEIELYNLNDDPFQLQNLYSALLKRRPQKVQSLEETAAALNECSAQECRDIENIPID